MRHVALPNIVSDKLALAIGQSAVFVFKRSGRGVCVTSQELGDVTRATGPETMALAGRPAALAFYSDSGHVCSMVSALYKAGKHDTGKWDCDQEFA